VADCLTCRQLHVVGNCVSVSFFCDTALHCSVQIVSTVGFIYFPVFSFSQIESRKHSKLKQSHSTPMEAQRERRCSSYSFTTSALDGVSGQGHAPAALYSRVKDPLPTGQEAEWAPEPVWTQMLEEKSFLPGIEPRSPGRPVRSQTLYWLSYTGSHDILVVRKNRC
jgi:hypothetical protein